MSLIEARARLFSANGTIVVVMGTTMVSDKLWDLEDMAALLDKAAPAKRGPYKKRVA
jgi:hypothetical protein